MADNKDVLTCPACGKEMEKVFIESMQKHLDVCLKGCGGMFFD
ncbi:MAG: zf-TFIIB domain-containing protein, partial [Candidatus Gastranaerophilales bacterium]|nr:zf-TFIIB domain-containing protein [Candidatus Gastranaerophilales bacterium]